MWLDRFSAHSTPSGSPRQRSFSPSAQSSGRLAPPQQPSRPAFSPRSSSLSLLSNASNHSLPDTLHRSRLTESDHPDHSTPGPGAGKPLEAVNGILGRTNTSISQAEKAQPKNPNLDPLERSIDFGGSSLEEFVAKDEAKSDYPSVEQYEREKFDYEDLHRSIIGCDEVLQSVEVYLASFQKDLGSVSAEIESLQSRSSALSSRLDLRKHVEALLGPPVENISISPVVISRIVEGQIDEDWTAALVQLGQSIERWRRKSADSNEPKAVQDVLPLLDDLKNKAIERIRDYLVVQIKALRSPNINAQIIQQRSFLQHRQLFSFLVAHNSLLAEQLAQAYINTMKWYYLNHFIRYRAALEKVRIKHADKNDLMGQEPQLRKAASAASTRSNFGFQDLFSLGRRVDILKTAKATAMSSYLAEEDKSLHGIEVPFRNLNLALIDNASAEYSFMTEFFSPISIPQITRKFNEIFEPTFALCEAYIKTLIEQTTDCLGLLLCVRLNQHFAFQLQRRKVPAMDSYINGTNIELWPRFQNAMDLHCESVRKASSNVSGVRAGASALSITGSSSIADAARQSVAPHPITQRFGQFLHGIILLSGESGDDEPVSNSLTRLRAEVEAFVKKCSKSMGDERKRQRFCFNNFSLIGTIIQDGDGKFADEQRHHFESLKKAYE